MKQIYFFISSFFAMLAFSSSIHAQSQALMESLAGEWHFVASNNGTPDSYGIYHAGTDDFVFTAKVADDGKSLDCHADCLYRSKSCTEYPADWRILVEVNNQGKHRIGWLLDDQKPAFSFQFNEPNENYMENGFWYFGGTDGGNRYMYLLGEDVDTGKKMSMTFWSAWSEEGIKSYSLANAEHLANIIYLLVSENIPYSGTVGYIEAWASPKVQREAFDTAVKEIPTDTHTSRGMFNLNGQMVEKPQHGVYVINGRKVLVK